MNILLEDKVSRRIIKPLLTLSSGWVTGLIVQEAYGDLYRGNFVTVLGAAFLLAFMANQIGKIMRYEPNEDVGSAS